MDPEEQVRIRIAAGVRVLHAAGLLDPFGHVSARLPGTDTIAVLAHLHGRRMLLADVTAADVTVVDADGQPLPGRAEGPGEVFIHTAIYRCRPEVQAVVHTHPAASVALSLAGYAVQPVLQRAAVFAPAVPVFSEGGQIDNPEMGRRLAECLGGAPAVVLRGHGAVTAGRSVEEAAVLALLLEEVSTIQMTAQGLARREAPVGAGVAAATPAGPSVPGEAAGLHEELVAAVWNRWLAFLERRGGLEGIEI